MPHSLAPSNSPIDTTKTYGDWRDDLLKNGYAVVKGVIPPERCDYYIDKMFEWVGRFPWGFDRNDRSTWGDEHLPTHMKGGMYHGYRVQHEKFMWEARTEPGVIDTFAKIWGTNDLLVSFDGMNFTLPPEGDNKMAIPQTQPWPHVDQDPARKGMACVQGILNFAPNGPDDGGLIVMKGSTNVMAEFFKTHPHVIGRPTWGTRDWFGFEKSELQWFKERGCEIVKVCAGPGDVVLWDSRTMHWNCVPETQNIRAVIYACYTPASFATTEALQQKTEKFNQRLGTTHWPHDNFFSQDPKPRLGKEDSQERDRPFEELEETEMILKLAGKVAY